MDRYLNLNLVQVKTNCLPDISQKDLTDKLEVISAIADSDVKSPNSIPVGTYIGEAETLVHIAEEDITALTAVGLDKAMISDLPLRAGALREAQSLWESTKFTHEQAEKDWLKKSPAAYDIRDDLLKSFRYAFRKQPDLLGRVSSIAEGYGNADMIQDLNDLSVLGKAHTDLLAGINFDMTVLDQAAQASDELADLLGLNTAEDEQNDEIKLRNRAYTHLKECVDEICGAGQYAFRNDDQRVAAYASAYRRRVRRAYEKNKADESATASKS